MRTTILKSQHLNWFETPTYYKICEINQDESKVLSFDELGNMSIKPLYDGYNEAVTFTVNMMCKNNYIIIDRKEFDEKYKTFVEQLNTLASR